MEHRRKQENPKTDWRAVERGWFLGEQAFKEELLEQMRGSRGDHYGPEMREAELVHAEGVLKEELKARRWTEEELVRRRKGDPEKVEIAWQLRVRTTVSLKWIAQRLNMGVWTHVSNCLAEKRQRDQKCQ